jgi:hypothetical protein
MAQRSLLSTYLFITMLDTKYCLICGSATIDYLPEISLLENICPSRRSCSRQSRSLRPPDCQARVIVRIY